jgi:hypothetical protein
MGVYELHNKMGDQLHDKMGVYELVDGKEVNGRGVWQMAGEEEVFMYYGSTKQWIIGTDRANMEAGKAAGWMKVDSTALTPDQITETWRGLPPLPSPLPSDYTGGARAFVDVPKVKARVYSTEEKRAVVERLQQERQQAMLAAMGARDIRVEGQEQGDLEDWLMGVYELVDGKEVNGRGVWQMAGGEELFMYYSNDKQWFIGDREEMEAGEDGGLIRVASTALTPYQVTETWKAYDPYNDEDIYTNFYVDAPKVKVRMYSVEEKRATVERLEQERVEAVRKEEAVVQQQQQDGRVVFKRVRGAVGVLDAAADYTITFREFATAAAPTAKVGIGSKIFYEFEVLQIGPGSCSQAGFASDRFDLTIDGYSGSGVGDDTCRYTHSCNIHHSFHFDSPDYAFTAGASTVVVYADGMVVDRIGANYGK